MKMVLAFIALSLLTACSAARVLVRDCQDLVGSDQKNCELVRKM